MSADILNKQDHFDQLLREIKKIIRQKVGKNEKLLGICQLLKNQVPNYNWVGFYIADDSKKELYLGPYVGAATEHARIPYGKGICGQAAQTEKTFVVQDVSRETNYLSCSVNVKSEIVVPIFKAGKIAGEIDIDSHYLAPFTAEDSRFLEAVAQIIAPII